MTRGCKSNNWKPDVITEFVRLMEDTKLSSPQIAQKLNRQFGTTLTKNAVIGYWYRMNGCVAVKRDKKVHV